MPAIMRWPGKIPPATVVEAPAMTIDILPTLAEITGSELPAATLDGRNMWHLMQGQTDQPPHHEAYWFYYRTNELHAVMSGDGKWKLYLPHSYRSLNGREGRDDGMPIPYDQNAVEEVELYHLEEDISETTNVADAHPEVVEELQLQVEKARLTLGDRLTDREGREVRPVGKIQ